MYRLTTFNILAFVCLSLSIEYVSCRSRFISQQLQLNSKIGAINSSSTISSPLPIGAAQRLLLVRGGSQAVDEDEDEYDDEMYDSDFDFDDDELLLVGDDNFAEESSLERAWIAFSQKTPPLTQGYMIASAAATLLGFLSHNNEFPSMFLLEWKPTLTKLQLWRPFTAFLNFGPFGLSYLMTAHFVWTYMSTLERMNHSHPYDFWLMIAFGCTSMVIGYGLLGLSPKFLGHNLSTFFVYVWARQHEGLQVNMMELFDTRAEMLPWFFLAQTALLEGEIPILDMLGIVFGHIYYHLKSVGALKAPKFVIDWYQNSDSPFALFIRNKYKNVSSDFEMM